MRARRSEQSPLLPADPALPSLRAREASRDDDSIAAIELAVLHCVFRHGPDGLVTWRELSEELEVKVPCDHTPDDIRRVVGDLADDQLVQADGATLRPGRRFWGSPRHRQSTGQHPVTAEDRRQQ